MKRSWLVVLVFCTPFLLSGCGGLLDSLREESEDVAREARREEAYNNTSERVRSGRGLSANSVSDYGTVEARKLRARAEDGFDDVRGDIQGEVDETRRRYSRADFVDGQVNENSLWNAQGQANYYFSQNNRFDNGDLVIVTVDRALKRDIQYALWKSLPAEQRRLKRKPASDDAKTPADKAKATAKAADPAKPPGKEDEMAAAEESAKSSMGAEKDGDMIRMEIIENLGNGLVRLKGEKRVVYRGRPKFVEISGLVRNSDIDEQSKTNSKTFLDMRSRVVQ